MIMFYNELFSPFTVVFMRAKAYVLPRISYVVVMNALVKGEIFKFIGR